MFNIIPYPKEVKADNSRTCSAPYIVNKVISPRYENEAYSIRVTPDEIVLKAGTEKGLFYAEKTFLQMKKQYPDNMPCVHIKDAPDYPYRGYMLDCARHFFTPAEIKKQIDIMALLKLNYFHWHLTEDQGWRIESDIYPNLTVKGSKRKQTAGDGKPVEGYYTKADIKDIVAYCAERHIEVIPEIDLPGHSGAAMAAYPFLSCTGKEMEVEEYYGVSPHVVCAGKETTYEFYFRLLTEVMELFPCKYFHLGGDEAMKANWLDCPDCQNAIKENNLKDEEELQAHLMTRIIRFINENGKTAILWNDALAGGNFEGDFVVQYWQQNRKNSEYAIREAQKGRKIIWSPFFDLYLDYPYGMTPLKKTYKSTPLPEFRDGLLGMEAPLWTEHVETIEKAEYQTYPRLIACAEKTWNERDIRSFTFRLNQFERILDTYAVHYAKDYNPSFVKGKINVVKFFRTAFGRASKEYMKLAGKTRKRIKEKYKL